MRQALTGLLAFLLLLTPAGARNLALRVHFFDVGQGDAVLIESLDGPNVLYDAGDSPAKIMAHLDRVGVSRVDLVIASHNHADHIGGMAEVIRRFRPRFYIDNGVPATTLTYRRVLDEVRAAGTQLLDPIARDIRLGNSALLQLLPPPGIAEWEQNDNSVGAVVKVGAFRLSLAGDAEQRQWRRWVQEHRLAPVTVHKASHHGSNNGDSLEALELLRPNVIVISVGTHNGYGHPNSEALARYAAIGHEVYRTDLHGTVVVEVDESGTYAIRAERSKTLASPKLLFQ